MELALASRLRASPYCRCHVSTQINISAAKFVSQQRSLRILFIRARGSPTHGTLPRPQRPHNERGHFFRRHKVGSAPFTTRQRINSVSADFAASR